MAVAKAKVEAVKKVQRRINECKELKEELKKAKQEGDKEKMREIMQRIKQRCILPVMKPALRR